MMQEQETKQDGDIEKYREILEAGTIEMIYWLSDYIDTPVDLEATLKLKWKIKDAIDADSLRSMLSKYGDIDALLVSKPKEGSKKQTAMISFKSVLSAVCHVCYRHSLTV